MLRKIAVCDDSPVVLRQLAQYFEQLQAEDADELVPGYYASAEEVLAHMPPDTELLLLDISMGGMNGIDCAKKLRDAGNNLPIIFITSMTEYAVEGYDVHAFAFLPKPITYPKFASVVTEALKKNDAGKPKPLLISTLSGVTVIDPAELVYAEVWQHETSFVMTTRRLNAPVQLAAVEPQLLQHGFFRCHRSYLVSLQQIRFIGQTTLTMSNGDEIPLSKHRRKEFMDCYSRVMGVQFA